jgi:hypothetical protein
MVSMKSQSAMEYLMTYGWAILIIAVVLGVLFQLGVFSGSALTPKAAPGACQVVRLGGQASLEGECQGQLPQYVGQFDGSTGYITIPENLIITTAMTASIWFDPSVSENTGLCRDSFAYYDFGYKYWIIRPFDCNGNNWVVYFNSGNGGNHAGASPYPALGAWQNMVLTYNGYYVQGYLNGVAASPAPTTGSLVVNGVTVIGGGGYSTPSELFQGELANAQLYNTSFSANEVLALYQEGIGGAPIKIQNLVGWWPLNGNAQDYSGNNDNGQITGGVSFNGTWQAEYTPP